LLIKNNTFGIIVSKVKNNACTWHLARISPIGEISMDLFRGVIKGFAERVFFQAAKF
jgi:hypothetical protein